MSTYDKLKGIPLTIESIAIRACRLEVSDGFTRVTSVVHLRGLGHEGLGEDLIYEIPDQEAFQATGANLPLCGEYDLGSFRITLDQTSLFSTPPTDAMAASYRKWALESAALDLALKQGGQALWQVLDIALRPVHFVVSLGLGNPPSTQRLQSILSQHRSQRFKLDATSRWSPDLMKALSPHTACVDLKGHYEGQSIYQPPEEELYRNVLACFPDAWIEDAAASPETRSIVKDNWSRLSWDAPIHSLADLQNLDQEPAALNIKPSRIGSLEKLLALYDHCRASEIPMYGGGEFELGPGRHQIQYLASLFHADGPNDVAPSEFNADPLPDNLPASPLSLCPAVTGFALR